MPRRRRSALPFALLAVLGLASCAADREAREPEPDPPVYESRSGVPILMDIPFLGFFFSHRRIVR